MSFVDGELYERSFDTPAGRIDVLAEIVIEGSTIGLRDIAVYPRGSRRLSVSLRSVAVSTALSVSSRAGFS